MLSKTVPDSSNGQCACVSEVRSRRLLLIIAVSASDVFVCVPPHRPSAGFRLANAPAAQPMMKGQKKWTDRRVGQKLVVELSHGRIIYVSFTGKVFLQISSSLLGRHHRVSWQTLKRFCCLNDDAKNSLIGQSDESADDLWWSYTIVLYRKGFLKISLRVCHVDSNCMSCSQFIPKIVLYQISSDDQSVVVGHITIPPPRLSPPLTYPCHSSPNSIERGLLIVFHCLLQTDLPSSLYSSALTTSLLMLSSSRHNHSHP